MVEGVRPSNKHMDQIAETVCDMFEMARKTDLNLIAVKMTGLIDPSLFEKVNMA